MARELHALEPAFREALERCDRAVRDAAGWSVLEVLHAPRSSADRLDQVEVVQPVLAAVTIAYGALWRALGVEPAAFAGHSMGEVAAAHLAGALSLEGAMRVVCARSALLRRVAGRGAMALVELSWDDARAALRGREDRLSVAASNGPRSTVLSGEPAALDEALRELDARGVFCRRVKVDVASHSPQVVPLAAELARGLAGLTPSTPAIPLVSTVLGRRVEGAELDAAYWARNLREPVRFQEAVERLAADGPTAFLELGPHPVLLPSIEQTARAAGADAVAVASGRREEPQVETLLAAAGALWASGVPLDWRRLLPEGAPVRLPLYPWQRERHWIEAADRRAPGAARARRACPDDASLGWIRTLRWVPAEPGPRAAPAPSRWLVVGPDPALAGALAGRLGGAVTAPLDQLETVTAAAGRDGTCGVVVLAPDGEAAPYVPVRTARAAAATAGRAPPRLWFVTRGAHAAGAAPERTSPWAAALWGAARVVGEEDPARWGGLADLAADAGPDALAPLAAHLLAGDREDQVALRDGRRLALRLVPADAARAPPAPALREDAAYLVTGGLGDLGLRAAALLAARGARHLVLVGRTPLPPRRAWGAATGAAATRVAAVRALEALGVAVHVAPVDVGERAALGAFLDGWREEGRPGFRGVLHCAGAFENRLVPRMDPAAFDAVLRAKLGGALHLDALLPDLDLFVLYSSIGGLLPQPGQANYAAASAGLDGLAADRVARGRPALSIAWGVWRGAGLVRNAAGEANVAAMEAQGLEPFEPERGVALLDWLLGHPGPFLAVAPIDAAARARARPGRSSPLLAGLAGAGPAGGAPVAAGEESARSREEVEAIVTGAVARVLKLPAAALDRRKALGAFGLTSLLAMELRNRLEAALGRPLPATLAWNHPTVAALVDHLAGGGGSAPAVPARPSAPAPAAALEAVAALSDEDAAHALRAGRKGEP
jgi:malonyl CoA-acyl carrier protein transacylase